MQSPIAKVEIWDLVMRLWKDHEGQTKTTGAQASVRQYTHSCRYEGSMSWFERTEL